MWFPFERLLELAINDRKDISFHSIRKSNKKLLLVSLKVYIAIYTYKHEKKEAP